MPEYQPNNYFSEKPNIMFFSGEDEEEVERQSVIKGEGPFINSMNLGMTLKNVEEVINNGSDWINIQDIVRITFR